mgnify:CR=1 FL=1
MSITILCFFQLLPRVTRDTELAKSMLFLPASYDIICGFILLRSTEIEIDIVPARPILYLCPVY